jgi:hypothetical protein
LVSDGISRDRGDEHVVSVGVVEIIEAVVADHSVIVETTDVVVGVDLPKTVRVDLVKLFLNLNDHVLIAQVVISIDLQDSGAVNGGVIVPLIL